MSANGWKTARAAAAIVWWACASSAWSQESSQPPAVQDEAGKAGGGASQEQAPRDDVLGKEGGSAALTQKEVKEGLTDVEKEKFGQSDYGPKVSALAIAAEESAWDDWSKRWTASKGGKMVGLTEARIATAGSKIQMAVVLATKGGPFNASEPLNYEVSIYRPDGSLMKTMPPSGCMSKGESLLSGYMGICDSVLSFDFEPQYPKGQWVFKVKLEVPGQKPLVFGTSFESY